MLAWLLVAVATTACAQPGPCQPIAPRVLPDGRAAGEGRMEESADGAATVTWGTTGPQRVTQRIIPLDRAPRPSCAIGEVPLELGCFPADDDTHVGGRPAVFFAADAGPAPAVEMSFIEASCLYQISVGPGLTPEQLKAYAAQF